jgi:hypothetical protein
MLSQDDHRRLGDIERLITLTDPDFAEGLRLGNPRPPSGDRRWPLAVWALAGLVMLVIGLVAVSPFATMLGGGGLLGSAVAYRRHVWKAHGERRRPWWRRG